MRASLLPSLATVLLLAPVGRAAEAQTRPAHYARAIAMLRDTIPSLMRRDSVLGLAVALVDGDSLVWAEGFGYTDASRRQPVTPATLFSLQSISKTYTAAGFLLAVDRHWFALDERLRTVWPQFGVRSRGNALDGDRITFRQLLAHRAGLPHEAPRGSNFDDCRCSLADHVASIRDVWLLAPPGERYAYSNLGFDLLAYALERRAGTSYAAYMREALFAPLGMTASTFDPDAAHRAASFARGQVAGRDAPLLAIPMVGAGGMYSNVVDMSRFVSFMLNRGRIGSRPFLSSASLRQMYAVQFPADGQVGGYGLGTFLKRWRGRTLVWHTGGGYGYTTAQEWIPALRIGVVVLTNDGGNGEVAGAVADRALGAMATILGVRDTTEAPPYRTGRTVTLPVPSLERLAGTYRSYSGLRTFRVVADRLHLVGNTDRPLTAQSPTEFTDGFDRYRFRRDASGDATVIDDLGDNGQDTFVLNERPGEAPGPAAPEWAQYVGDYEGRAYGQPVPAQISLKNGYLWASTRGGSKLLPYRPGLFFTVWGESVEFRGDTLWMRAAPFLRVRRDRN